MLSTGIAISKNINSRTAGVSSQLSPTLKKFTLDGKVTVVTSAGKRKLHFSLIVFEVSNLTLLSLVVLQTSATALRMPSAK
jgi:predicted Zn-dependent protease